MKIVKIHYPLIEATARFKVITIEEAEEVVEKYSNLPKLEYTLKVLETCIFNLKTDILLAIRKLSPMAADEFLTSLYNGCVMLNPVLDIPTWMNLSQSYNIFHEREASFQNELPPPLPTSDVKDKPQREKKKNFTLSAAKFANLQSHLQEKVIGQPEAIGQIVSALKRAQACLNDPNRPICVFFFTGPSGVGKTLIAKELQSYMFGDADLVRIDCGEYQHKHENQKLIGSPPGFVGSEEGGQLTKAIAANPNTVLLLDEAEKAHPDFWNTFLKVFDEGFLTDNKGNKVSFKNTVIIITSNLGNDRVSEAAYGNKAGFMQSNPYGYKTRSIPKREMVERESHDAIRKFFKPEFVNRLDDIVVFNNLTDEDYYKIAELELFSIAEKLSKQQYDLAWNDDAVGLLTSLSGITVEGARGMSKIRRNLIENPLADLLLTTKYPKGTIFNVTVQNDGFIIT